MDTQAMIDYPERIGTHPARANRVVHGLRLFSAVGNEFCIGIALWPRQGLARANVVERRLSKDAAYQAQAKY